MDADKTVDQLHIESIRAALEDALIGIIGRERFEEAFSEGEAGDEFLAYIHGLYESMDESEKAAAAFPFIMLDDSEEEDTYEAFPDVRWHVSYDAADGSRTCSTRFQLDGYEDYRFEVSVIKPELSGYYFVNKLAVCGADIYHRVYSEFADDFVDEYPVIGEHRFSDVLAQIQSEVERATNGRYDDTVLEDYWADKAEEQYNSIMELYNILEN